MSDYSELERRAQAAIDAIGTLSRARQEREFNDVCTPQVVLALIAENDLQRKDLQNLRTDNAQLIYALKQEQKSYLVLRDERDRLRAEVAGLKTGYEAYERVNAELKAENDLLRKQTSDTAQELRKASSWICREVEAGTKSATHWAVRLHEKADQLDAAMGKGEQP